MSGSLSHARRSVSLPPLGAPIEDLVDSDVNNVLDLFGALNKGTHGHAGCFTITQLNAIRIRVESAIGFIHALVSAARLEDDADGHA